MNNTFGQSELWLTDLANLSDARGMCRQILQQHERLDAVVNNAGVLQKPGTQTPTNRDIRFEVNTIASCLNNRELLSIIDENSIILKVSSVAKVPVDIEALEQFWGDG